jgi:signal peptidase I
MATTLLEPKQAQPQQETTLEYIASLCSLFITVLFAFTFIFQNFEIPSGSMKDTLLIGDHVLADRETFAPPAHWAPFDHHREIRRGDLIVFYKPREPKTILVKRAIGIPGDHIHLRNGIVYLNGQPQNEPQAAKPTESNYEPYRDDFPAIPPQDGYGITATWALDLPNHIVNGDLVVPPGHYFAMGDNRVNSLDSRFWGFVPRENILGRPMFVYWSFMTPDDQMYKTSMQERAAFFSHEVLHFFDQTRWRRTLHLVK